MNALFTTRCVLKSGMVVQDGDLLSSREVLSDLASLNVSVRSRRPSEG